MSLQFESPDTKEFLSTSDAATRVLSATPVETDFVARVYEKISSVYDVFYGPTLHAGRLESIGRLGIRPGDQVLEVGVGTGINASLYPRDCEVTGIDLCESMLENAGRRIARHRLTNIRLMQMDAEALTFPDDSFDIGIADAWLDNQYSNGFWTSGHEHCPVSMVAGTSASNASARASNEEYDYVYSDPTAPFTYEFVSVSGCDPKQHNP